MVVRVQRLPRSLLVFLKGLPHSIRGRLRRPRTGEEYLVVLGAAMLLTILIITTLSFLFVPYDPNLINPAPATRLAGPSATHLMGTDALGRDIYSRILTGAPTVLQVLALSAIISVTAGVPSGLFSGYLGGTLDKALSLVMDSIYAFPGLVLAIAIAVALGPGVVNIAVAVALVYVPTYFRVARSHTLTSKEESYVEAGKALGASNWTLIRKYLLPSILPSLAAILSLNVADAMLTEAGLSFLGLGLPPGTPDWGYDISQGQGYFLSGYWWLVAFPGLMIVLVVLGFSLVGEGLNEILNPRLRGRQV